MGSYNMETFAKLLVIGGIVMIVLGGLVLLLGRMGIVPFRLPGDIRIVGNNMTCVIALGTSILLSIILTVILNVVIRLMK